MYKPGPDFEEDVKDPLLEISLTGSKEIWLIQWPINQLKPCDVNGKEITLKLRNDGDLGSFESSSGKKYDVVSFAAQEPDATVFQVSGSESKVVGKISRRVCLIQYPEPSELEKPTSRFSTSHRSGGSQSRSMLRAPATSSKHQSSTLLYGTSRETLTSAYTVQQSTESTKHSKHKRARDSSTSIERTTRSAGQSSRGSRPESNATHTSGLTSLEKSHGKKSKEKKKRRLKNEEQPFH